MKIENKVITTTSFPTLSVEIVSDKTQYIKILSLCQEWYKAARSQYNVAQESQLCNEKIGRIRSSYTTIDDIIDSLKHNSSTIYVAISTTNKKIQGIAAVNFLEEVPELCALATNPDNLSVFDTENAIRGSGTALVTAIARDIINNQKLPKRLSVISNIFAYKFYIKLGFQHSTNNRLEMYLDEREMSVLTKTPCAYNGFLSRGSSQTE